MATQKRLAIASNLDVLADVVEKHGRAIMQKAVEQTLDSNYDAGDVSLALKYHASFLPKVLPVFPALINLSCEAAGGKMEKFVGIGAALTLFVEAANIHDDVIDQTKIKRKRKTTFGKFGNDVALLAGDVMLVQAAFSLVKECEQLDREQKDTILLLTFQSLNKICKSAAKESSMRRRFDVSSHDYLEVVSLRASVSQVHCTIGGILGGGTKKMISYLGNYGKTYGIVGTVIDEFMDLYNYDKFSNRLKNECVPLPVLCALKNAAINEKLIMVLNKFEISRKEHGHLVKVVVGSEEVKNLQREILELSNSQIYNIERELIKSCARGDLLTLNRVLQKLLCNLV